MTAKTAKARTAPVESELNQSLSLGTALKALVAAETARASYEAAALTAGLALALTACEDAVIDWAIGRTITAKAKWGMAWNRGLYALALDGHAIWRGEESEALATRTAKARSLAAKEALAKEHYELTAKDVREGLAKAREIGRPLALALIDNEAQRLKDAFAASKGDVRKFESAFRKIVADRYFGGNLKALTFAALKAALTPKSPESEGEKAKGVAAVWAKLQALKSFEAGDVAAMREMRDFLNLKLASFEATTARLTGKAQSPREAANAKVGAAVKAAKAPRKPRQSKAEKALGTAEAIHAGGEALAAAIAA